MARYWILQFNPENLEHNYQLSNLKEAINNGEEIWSIRQHANEVKKDDIAYIFKTGENRGIYALARFDGHPYKDTDGEFISKLIFDMDISKSLLESPILMNELDNLNLINARSGYRGTVFSVENFQAERINALIKIHFVQGQMSNKKSQSDKLSKQVILCGPPGTGKTYNTKRRAIDIIEGKNGNS